MSTNNIGQILIVDDELELKNILVEALTAQGYAAAGFTSGEEALAVLRDQPFDVLLTDLMMPAMDGITLVKEALQIDPHLVCMVMTGQGTIQTAVDAMKEGAFDYVLKPFRLQTVLPVLTRAMNTRRMRLENLHLRETIAIHELSQTIAFTLDPQTVIEKLADAALQQTEADEVSVLLPTHDGGELYVAAVRGENRERLLGERVLLAESISGWVAREREPLILDGAINDQRFRSLWPQPEISSAASIPMQVAGKVVGTLNINALDRARPFTPGQLKALSILAGTAAAALESAALYTQVQKAERNYRSIFENAIEGVFQATREGRYLSANPALARILGYDSPQDLIESVTDIQQQIFVDPKCRSEVLLIVETQGALRNFETQVYRKDGEKIWVSMNIRAVTDERDQSVHCEGTLEDITERKHSERELRKMSMIVENSRDLIGIASTEGAVLFVNHTGQKMVGLESDDQALATNLMDYVVEEDRELAGNILNAVLRQGHWEGEIRFKNFQTGALIPILQHVFMVTDDEGENNIALATICRDITERKRAEEDLRFQKSLLESQSEASIDGILAVSADRKLLSFNRRFLEMWGLSEGVIGSQSDETAAQAVISKVENPKEFLDRIEYLYKHPAESSQDEIFLKDGRVFDRYSAPIKGPDAEYYGRVWFFHDITERKQREVALHQSEERYRELVENAQDIIYSHDLQGNYTASNKAGEEITGYTLEESLKLNLTQTVAPEYVDKAREMLSRKLAGEEITAYELELIAKDGHRVPIEVNTRLVIEDGVPVGVTGIARDITERKRADAELRRLAAAVEETADSVVITDKNGNIQYVNPAFERVSGYTKEEALNQNPRILKSGKTDPSVYKELWETITRGDAWNGHLTNRKKDGTLFEERVTISPVRDASGAIVSYIAVKQDITQQLQLEQQLRQSQRLEAIGQLAGGVAHDFNNLLTAILGYSDLTLAKLEPASPLINNLHEIKKAGERAASLTRQLLAFSRKQVLTLRVLDLNSVIGDINKMLRRLIGEHIELITKFGVDLGAIKADPTQIEQVIMNLVVNARDAMPDGGTLTIETRNVTFDEEYVLTHQPVQIGDYVVLVVSDTGCGMDAETQARIFEPFFTTKGVGKGTGLGLSTIYGIVKQSGGYVWVYSEVGMGTTFKVYLPRVFEEAPDDVPVAREIIPAGGTESILVVEDNVEVRRLILATLQAAGYSVIDCGDGREALAIVEECGNQLHLLITDVVMPSMGGRELAEQTKKIAPDARVLFISGYTDDAVVRAGISDQEIAFLEKPFTPVELIKKVGEVMKA